MKLKCSPPYLMSNLCFLAWLIFSMLTLHWGSNLLNWRSHPGFFYYKILGNPKWYRRPLFFCFLWSSQLSDLRNKFPCNVFQHQILHILMVRKHSSLESWISTCMGNAFINYNFFSFWIILECFVCWFLKIKIKKEAFYNLKCKRWVFTVVILHLHSTL